MDIKSRLICQKPVVLRFYEMYKDNFFKTEALFRGKADSGSLRIYVFRNDKSEARMGY